MCFQRATGCGAHDVETILHEWNNQDPTRDDGGPIDATARRPDVFWTHAGVKLVLDMVDTKLHRRYTLSQIAEVLNREETAQIYKHPKDLGRVFTRGNIQALLNKYFPPDEDTQAAVALLGEGVVIPTWLRVLSSPSDQGGCHPHLVRVRV